MATIEQLRSLIYEKHRINIEPNDPVFQIFALLIENNEALEKERYELIQKRVDEILSTAEQTVHMQTEAAKEVTRDMIKELASDIRQNGIENVSVGEGGSVVKTKLNDLLLFGICAITAINLLINLVLLYK